MVLPVPVSHMKGRENAVSLASRLSAGNGYRSLRSFLASGRVSLRDLSVGDDKAIAKLASWSGAEATDLSQFAIRTETKWKHWSLGRATFNKDMRPGKRFRYCPNCVHQDCLRGSEQPASRPFMRAQWLTKAVLNCTEHLRPLIEVDFAKFYEEDFARYVAANHKLIEAQAAEPFQPQSVDVDRFVENRISGVNAEKFLDQFEAHVAVELCHYLGNFMKRHYSTWTLLPPFFQSSSPREAGFHIARRGTDAISHVILTFVNARKLIGDEKFSFGQLGRWLRSNNADSRYTAIVDLFQNVVVMNLPLGPGDVCFVPVQERHLHSVVSASRHYGLFEKRVIQLMQDAGLIVPQKQHPSRILFDAKRAHAVLEDASRTMTSREVREDLAITEAVMADILDNGLIRTVENREDARAYARIKKEDVVEFKARIARSTTTSDLNGLSTITDVCQACGCLVSDVLSLVLHAKLSNVAIRNSYTFRLHDLRVDLAEAVETIVTTRVAEWKKINPGFVSTYDARAELQVKKQTISYLVQSGSLVAKKLTSPQVMRRQDYISLESIRRFQAQFIALGELAKCYETHPIVITTAMEKLGIKTSPEKAGTVTRFYRRTEVNDCMIREAVAKLR